MRILHANGFTENEMREFGALCQQNASLKLSRYFERHAERVLAPDFYPNFNDIVALQATNAATASDVSYQVEALDFQMTEVSFSRKWSDCFEDATAILFVADLAALSTLPAQLSQFDQLVNASTFFFFFFSWFLFLKRGVSVVQCGAFVEQIRLVSRGDCKRI
jgi:hypothetical protein